MQKWNFFLQFAKMRKTIPAWLAFFLCITISVWLSRQILAELSRFDVLGSLDAEASSPEKPIGNEDSPPDKPAQSWSLVRQWETAAAEAREISSLQIGPLAGSEIQPLAPLPLLENFVNNGVKDIEIATFEKEATLSNSADAPGSAPDSDSEGGKLANLPKEIVKPAEPLNETSSPQREVELQWDWEKKGLVIEDPPQNEGLPQEEGEIRASLFPKPEPARDPSTLWFRAFLAANKAQEFEAAGRFEKAWLAYQESRNYYEELMRFAPDFEPKMIKTRLAHVTKKLIEPEPPSEWEEDFE